MNICRAPYSLARRSGSRTVVAFGRIQVNIIRHVIHTARRLTEGSEIIATAHLHYADILRSTKTHRILIAKIASVFILLNWPALIRSKSRADSEFLIIEVVQTVVAEVRPDGVPVLQTAVDVATILGAENLTRLGAA